MQVQDNEVIKRAGGEVAMLNWSGLDKRGRFRQPRNAHEIFSMYSRATGCSFEDAMNQAAQTLLSKWKEDFQAETDDS